MLQNKKIALVVTGGIAAYKMPLVVRELIKRQATVRVVMTQKATEFVTTKTMEVLTKYPVLIEGQPYPEEIGHIALSDWADCVVVCPTTANTIAKLANGIGDNEATSFLLATKTPPLIIPAMNERMWENQVTQKNCQQLRDMGYAVLEPASGYLAEGYEGKGRMIAVEAIIAAIQAYEAIQDISGLNLKGETVVISAGGTREAIDPVRYIANRSSGKMGAALALVSALAGAKVKLVVTSTVQKSTLLPQIEVEEVVSAQEMNHAMHQLHTAATITIMAAAVSDYRVVNVSDHKIKKIDHHPLQLQLTENPDILASLPNKGQYLVGFAAETDNVVENATSKRQRKGVDMIVANDVSDVTIGFGSEQNAVRLITKEATHALEKQSKFDIAAKILRTIQEEKSRT